MVVDADFGLSFVITTPASYFETSVRHRLPADVSFPSLRLGLSSVIDKLQALSPILLEHAVGGDDGNFVRNGLGNNDVVVGVQIIPHASSLLFELLF